MALPPGFAPLDFEAYHRDTLAAHLTAGRGRLAAETAASLPSLALRLPDGAAFTYRAAGGDVAIEAGDAGAATVIELDLEAWQGLVHELEAPAGLVYAGRVRCRRGAAVDLMAWETALRALYHGRPPYHPATLALRDGDGRRLDAQATFTPDAAPEAMTHFLRTAGYLFVRGVFGADEAARLAAEASALRREARPGDKLSWWGTDAAGEAICCRVTRGGVKPGLATLPAEPRLLALAALAGEALVHTRGEGEGVTVIYKHPGMRAGLGDLPWHRDCGMGGHALMCPTLLLSVYLRAATPESGELAMLPGSHRAAYNAHDPRLDAAAHAAHFAAQPGDVSLHFSDTVHAAPPPTSADPERCRISAVLSFAPPSRAAARAAGSYNDALHQRADGQIEHLDAVARRL